MNKMKLINQIDMTNLSEIQEEIEARRKNIDLCMGDLYKNIMSAEVSQLHDAYMKLRYPPIRCEYEKDDRNS